MDLKKFIKNTLQEHLNESLSLIRGVGNNQSSNVDLFGRGLYLTDDIDVAKFYGDTIKSYSVGGKIFDTKQSFSPQELKKFCMSLNSALNTNYGSTYLRELIQYNDGKVPGDIDYVSISWALNSRSEFDDILEKNNLLTNDFNSYANTCTAMNLALQKMGYVGLKYSTSDIEDLDDRGMGNRNAYLIFDVNSASETKSSLQEQVEVDSDEEDLKWVIRKLAHERNILSVEIDGFWVTDNGSLAVLLDEVIVIPSDFGQWDSKSTEKVAYYNDSILLSIKQNGKLSCRTSSIGNNEVISTGENWTDIGLFIPPNRNTTDNDWEKMAEIVERIILNNI